MAGSETARVEPALTPEEWATGEASWKRDEFWGYSPDRTGNVIVGIGKSGVCLPEECAPQIMALANFVLHDGHPQKITRGMVEHLKRLNWSWRQYTLSDNTDPESRDAWSAQTWAVIQALDALLPPDA